MTAIQPGPGFVNLVNNLLHAGADNLPAAINAHVLAQTEARRQLPDPYLNHWHTPRPGRALIASLDEHGQVTGVQEMAAKYADDEHTLKPTTTIVINLWGGETR